MSRQPKILIYGYGNPGRQDDGLGNLFIDLMESWSKENNLDNICFDSNYQLNIEDAAEISSFDIVIFVDASIEQITDYLLTEITPSSQVEFTMHSVSASYVVKLCSEMFGKSPEAYLLHIKGYEWEFRQGITDMATNNCRKAVEFMKPLLILPEKLKKTVQAVT